MKILIYGVGNPYRCDDAVGIKIADDLKKTINKSNITVKSGSIDGLVILDEVVGFDKVIFIDSVKSDRGMPGDIYKIKLDPSQETQQSSATHNIDFVTAIRTGNKLGYRMPQDIIIYGIEIEDNVSFGEECSEKVKASIPEAVERILTELNE